MGRSVHVKASENLIQPPRKRSRSLDAGGRRLIPLLQGADRRWWPRRGRLASVDPGEHRVLTGDDEAIGYDALLVAVGAVKRALYP
jgi:NADPH-dependent 2,4-dienoyl-CoA reductase/sulfur reductase-like enzyme